MVCGLARLFRPEHPGRRHPAASATGWRLLRTRFGVVGLKQQPASYYHAAAVRARRLLAEATTHGLKEHLGEEVACYEQLAEEIERASEPGSDFAAAEVAATSRSQTPANSLGFGVAPKSIPG
jgi:hypothetical protein